MFNGFAGKNSKKSHPKDFLPFPGEFEDDKTNKVSFKTADILKRLLKDKKLSPKTVSLLSPILGDVLGVDT